MPKHPLFDRHIQTLLAQAPQLAEHWLAATVDALQRPTENGLTSIDRRAVVSLLAALEPLRANAVQALAEHLRAGFTGAQARALGHGASAAAMSGFDISELSLVDESQAEKDVEISRIVQLVDIKAEWELRELQGLAAGLLPDAAWSEDATACSPAVFARAISQTVYGLAMADELRALWMRAAAPALAAQARAFYASTAQTLKAAGAQAPRYRTILTPSAASTGGETGAATPAPLAELLQRLPLLQAGLPAQRPAAARVASAEGIDEATLADLASFKLEPMAGDGQIAANRVEPLPDAAAQELLGRVFTRLLADPQLDTAIRGSIARLQTPLQQLAQNDQAVLLTEKHPAWGLINQIAAHAADLPAQDSSRNAAFQRFVAPLVERLSLDTAVKPEAFEQALGDVQRFVAQDRIDQVERSRPALDALGQAEQAKRLLQVLRQQVELQLDRAGEILGPVLDTFLRGPWIEVLSQALNTQGPEAPQTQALIGTVDELLASLPRPETEAERAALRRSLPGLIDRLQQGMALIDLPKPHRERVLDHLMQVHRVNLSERPEPPRRSSAPQAVPIPADLLDDLPVRQPLAEPPDLDDTPSPFAPTTADWGSDTHIGALPTVPMGLDEGNDPLAAAAAWLAGLRAGQRCKLYLQGCWATAVLVWRSENGEFFMFTSKLAGGTHSLTRRALKRLRSEGLATDVADPSAVQRALHGVIQELGGG